MKKNQNRSLEVNDDHKHMKYLQKTDFCAQTNIHILTNTHIHTVKHPHKQKLA